MRSYAVIPPIVLDEVRRNYRYDSKNGLIPDPMAEYKVNKNINIWTDHEKDIFREKYLQHPKNFVLIGSYLEKKTVADCIHYYYSTKKKENYKAQVKRRIRKPRATKGAGGGGAPPQSGVPEVVGVNSTGVTTRGSVAALQKEQQQSGRPDTNSAPNSPPPASAPPAAAAPPSAPSPSPADKEKNLPTSSVSSTDAISSPAISSSATTDSTSSTSVSSTATPTTTSSNSSQQLNGELPPKPPQPRVEGKDQRCVLFDLGKSS